VVTLGLVPSLLELAYQHTDFTEIILEIDPNLNLISLTAQFLSLLESYIRSTFLPPDDESEFPECLDSLITFVATNADLQLLIDSNLLRTVFSTGVASDLLIELIESCVESKRSDLMNHLVLVGLVQSLEHQQISLQRIE
jgi:hypothetical protein